MAMSNVRIRLKTQETCKGNSPILMGYGASRFFALEDRFVAERRIKPHKQQVEEDARRAAQRYAFRRNQVIGVLMIAAVVLAWWLFHTNPKWIFPPGWWRL